MPGPLPRILRAVIIVGANSVLIALFVRVSKRENPDPMPQLVAEFVWMGLFINLALLGIFKLSSRHQDDSTP